VDEWSRPVFNTYIKQDMRVLSRICELTVPTKEIMYQHGLSLGKISKGIYAIEYSDERYDIISLLSGSS